MNTMRMNNGVSRQELAGMGNIGEQGSSMNGGNALERLANIDPAQLREMEDYSFSDPSNSVGGNPMKVNVHFHYPRDYKQKIENGAFGAKELEEQDNLLENVYAYDNDIEDYEADDDFAIGEDGVYNDFENFNDNHYDDYYFNGLQDDEDYEDDLYYEDDNNQEYIIDNYDYYSDHYGDAEDGEEHEFAYQEDDDSDNTNDALDGMEGNAAFINIGYDENLIDSDMRISVEKGENRYVPYINPDVTGFNQKVRISWNTFWKLQLFAIMCGVVIFVSIAVYLNNPFKNLEWPSLYLAQQQRPYNVKVFENNDDNIVDYDYGDNQDENEQLKE